MSWRAAPLAGPVNRRTEATILAGNDLQGELRA